MISQAGVCDDDAADHCSGISNSCLDAYQPSTVSCTGTSNGGVCDGDDHCSGTGNVCVDDYLTSECRASTATCDPAEFCNGMGGACPADAQGTSAPLGPTISVVKGASNVATISWTEAIPGPFNVYRGTIKSGEDFSYNQSCFENEVSGSSTTDMQLPARGWAFFYLVSRVQPPCAESTVGQDGAGSDRPNPLVCTLPPPDSDGDGYQDALDNCRSDYNPSQLDLDQDGVGDVCDNCPNDSNKDQSDSDDDGIGDVCE